MSSRRLLSATAATITLLAAGSSVAAQAASVTTAAFSGGTGTFTAGSFNLQGSTNGTAYSDHAAAPGATLPFTVVQT